MGAGSSRGEGRKVTSGAGSMRRGLRSRRHEPGGFGPPENLLQAIWLCLKHPSLIINVGVGGVSGRRMLIQLAVGFVLLSFLLNLAVSSAESGFSPSVLAAAVVGTINSGFSLFVVSFCMYFVAQVSKSSVDFPSILSGLAFLRVISLSILIVVGVAVAIPALFYPGAFWTVAGWGLVSYVLITFILQALYVMGVFEAGCLGSLMLSMVASLVAAAINAWLRGILIGLLGV